MVNSELLPLQKLEREQKQKNACSDSSISEWRALISKNVVNIENIQKFLDKNEFEKLKKVVETYPMCINPYYLSLIKEKNDSVYKQCIPDEQELTDNLEDDPLCEEAQSPVPGLIHRYPDRVLLLVSNKCAMYCRFCTRKRKVGKTFVIRKKDIFAGIKYIESHKEVRDVILSGGDPLMLEDDEIEQIIKKIRAIKHVEIIRIGTRVPCTLPQRITPELCSMLKKYHPLFINTHFNHPDEITEEAEDACNMLANAGIPLGNQTVLLKGVNDNPETMKKLMQKLLKIRVKPYYIYQCDMVKGTNHFRTSVEKGLEIIKALRGFTSGMAVPHYVIDAPDGGGKIPLLPEYVIKRTKDKIILKNYKGTFHEYIEAC